MKKADEKTIEREKALVSRCINGEKKGWDEFVDKYKALIYHAILSSFNFAGYRNVEEAAGDIFQDVFTALLKDDYAKLRGFGWKNGCSIASWLHIVAKNVTFDYLRKYFKHGEVMEPLAEGDDSESAGYRVEESEEAMVLEKMETEERNELFEKALKALPKEDFLLIDFIYFRGISHEKAAGILGKSVDAVYMQKKRIIDKIKKTIEADYGKHDQFNKRSV